MSNEEILEALRGVEDPEAGMSIVDLGLVYCVEHTAHGVRVDLTMLDGEVLYRRTDAP